MFRLGSDNANPLAGGIRFMAEAALGNVLGFNRLDKIYRSLPEPLEGHAFAGEVLDRFGLDYRVSEEDAARIPTEGPVVVTANHPFGGIEGLIMADILLSVRPDARIMANYLLARIRELRDLFIFVDPFGSSEAARKNIGAMKTSLGLLKKGGALGVFPAGEVSHLAVRDKRLKVSDPDWSPTVAGMVRRSKATVVPMYFEGRNSVLFQSMGLVHPRLRTALLPREFLNKSRRPVNVRIGNPIPYARLMDSCESDVMDDEFLIRYLRLRTTILKNRAPKGRVKLFIPKSPVRLEALAAPVDPALLEEEIGKLPPEQTLFESGDFSVICADAGDMPLCLREIGRLREATFRKVGEGTGKSLDLDEFDNRYLHLFLWNVKEREIAGAYRVGRTDKILKKYGRKGLYTGTLFKISPKFHEQIGPALEMGRSFVRPKYQKGYAPLLLLWKGLARLVVEHPQYRVLFGPVSISNEYKHASRRLIAGYFEHNEERPEELARLVKPRTPLKDRSWLRENFKTLVSGMDDLLDLLADLESDQKGIPVLLRQYLKLGGKLLAFNVDQDFSDALDGLIVVDLLETNRRQLERYMGREGAASFLKRHLPGGGDETEMTPAA